VFYIITIALRLPYRYAQLSLITYIPDGSLWQFDIQEIPVIGDAIGKDIPGQPVACVGSSSVRIVLAVIPADQSPPVIGVVNIVPVVVRNT
jgi:hypothetical protein